MVHEFGVDHVEKFGVEFEGLVNDFAGGGFVLGNDFDDGQIAHDLHEPPKAVGVVFFEVEVFFGFVEGGHGRGGGTHELKGLIARAHTIYGGVPFFDGVVFGKEEGAFCEGKVEPTASEIAFDTAFEFAAFDELGVNVDVIFGEGEAPWFLVVFYNDPHVNVGVFPDFVV